MKKVIEYLFKLLTWLVAASSFIYFGEKVSEDFPNQNIFQNIVLIFIGLFLIFLLIKWFNDFLEELKGAEKRVSEKEEKKT